MCNDAHILLALQLTPGGGRTAIHKICAIASRAGMSIETLASLTPHALASVAGGSEGALAGFVQRCGQAQRGQAERLLHAVHKAGGRAMPITSTEYPVSIREALRHLAPPLLFLRGHDALVEQPCAAIVGARRISSIGAHYAAACAGILAALGVPIVSGGAAGADTAAHQEALEEGGSTMVALPQGLLTYQPPRYLEAAMDEGRALLLSEFAPDAPWEIPSAVTRNATISALARLVCVFEPRKAGGSIRTARCALEQGKPVLVYCAPDCAPVAYMLRQAGAVDLVLNEKGVEPIALADAWRTARPSFARQAELF